MQPELESAGPPPTGDLSTQMGVAHFTAWWLAKTVIDFNRRGRVIHHAVVFATQSIDGKPYAEPIPHVIYDNGGMAENVDSKNRFRAGIRELCKRTKAVGVMMVVEAWFRTNVSKEDMARADKRGLEADPLREEAIFVSLDHLANKQMVAWVAPITRGADGAGRVTDFRPYGDVKAYEGRFTELFPRELYS